MKKNNPLSDTIPHLCILIIATLMLIFLSACYGEKTVGSNEMRIYVEGTVTDITSGSPMEDVEIQFYSVAGSLERLTKTNQAGQYSIPYYGKCRTADLKTTFKVGVRPPAGYKYILPASYQVSCTTETQTFNFQLEPLP